MLCFDCFIWLIYDAFCLLVLIVVGLISVCLLFFGFVLLVIALGLVLPLLCGVILFYCLDLAVVHLLCVDWVLIVGCCVCVYFVRVFCWFALTLVFNCLCLGWLVLVGMTCFSFGGYLTCFCYFGLYGLVLGCLHWC